MAGRFALSSIVRRRNVLTVLGLAIAGLVLRALAFAAFPHPGYPDADYYTAVARELAAGHGLVAPYLWSFLEVGSKVPADALLPVPAFGHWLPLASFVQVPFIWLFGPTDLASALPFLLLGALLGPATYFLARDVAPRISATLAGALALSGGAVAGYLGQPDNYIIFALAATGALWAAGRLARDGRAPLRLAFIAGLCVGLAALARADGLLLTPALALGVLWAWRAAKLVRRRAALALVVMVGGLALLLIPWWVHQITLFGSPYPSATAGRILFIREPMEMFSADGPLGPDHLLSWDTGALLASRVTAVGDVIRLLGIGVLSIFGLPLALLGAFALRRWPGRQAWAPFMAWLVIWLAFEILLAAPHLTSGNLIHSGLAVLPWTAIAAAAGIQVAAARAGRWAGRSFILAGGVAVALSCALALGAVVVTGATFTDLRAAEAPAVDYLVAHDPTGRAMSPDPGGLWQAGHLAGVQTPASDLGVVAQAVRAYGVRWLLLLRTQTPPPLIPVLDGSRPAWLGAPVLVGPLEGDGLAWALYPVLPTAP